MSPQLHAPHPRTPCARRAERGVTIVELMVGMVVALLVAMAAAGSAQMFNASQRQAMSTGAASLNIASTMSAIKNDAANAGLGFFGNGLFLCATLNLSSGAGILVNGTAFSPITLTRGVSHDTVAVVSASDVASGSSVRLKAATAGGSAMVSSLLPITVTAGVKPAVLLARAGPPAGLCTVRTATTNTAADPAIEAPQTIMFDNTGKYNQGAFALPPTYAEDDYLSLLGTLNWNSYSVNANRELVMTQVLQGTTAVLASNVVAFRAQYGLAPAPGVRTLDDWVNPDAFVVGPGNITQVRAIRMGVVVRSRQPEKADKDGEGCKATTQMPRIFPNDVAAVTPDLPAGQWQCYRYRVATVIVPLRNIP